METIIKKHIERLVAIGLKQRDAKSLSKKLRDKHVSRYEDIIKFLRRNSLEISLELIEGSYRADIVIRRIIDESLKAYETSIKSKIMIFAEKMSWTLTNNFGIKFDNWSNEKKSVRDKKNAAKFFLVNGINKIIEKFSPNVSWNAIINEMQLGQIIALLSVIDVNSFNNIFIWDNCRKHFTKNEIIWKLECIGQLRNLIAHANILFKAQPFKGRKFESLALSSVIDFMNQLFNGKYKDSLSGKIEKYIENCRKKRDKDEWYNIDDQKLLKLLIAFKKEVLND